MSSLFAPAGAAGGSGGNNGRVLVAFRAGKMNMGSGNRLTADPKRGKVEVRLGADQLVHFQWVDRSTGEIADDLIVFPEEAHLRKLKQVKDGRVLMLEFTGSERRHFFWMQEPKDDRDSEFVSKVNEFMNNPPQGQEGGSDAALDNLPEDVSQLPPHLLQQLQAMGPGGMEQAQQLIRMLNAQREAGGAGRTGGTATPKAPAAQPKTPSATTPAASETASASGPTGTQLANILAGLGASPAAEQQRPQSLARVMDAQTLLPLLTRDEKVAQQLLKFLPEGQQTMDELNALPRSGQWQQFLDTFGAALQNGQLGAVLSEMGLGDLKPAPTLEEFFEALQKKSGGGAGDQSSGAGRSGDNDTEMGGS